MPVLPLCSNHRAEQGAFSCAPWVLTAHPRPELPPLPVRGASLPTAVWSLSLPHPASWLVCLHLTLKPPSSLSAICSGPGGFSVPRPTGPSPVPTVPSSQSQAQPEPPTRPCQRPDRTGQKRTGRRVLVSSERRQLVITPELFILNPRISSFLSTLPSPPSTPACLLLGARDIFGLSNMISQTVGILVSSGAAQLGN